MVKVRKPLSQSPRAKVAVPETRVVNISGHRKWKEHERYVYIGRPTIYGNPYTIGRDGDREIVIRRYRAMLRADPILQRIILQTLKGKVLGCYCKPLPCHGDVIKELIDTGRI